MMPPPPVNPQAWAPPPPPPKKPPVIFERADYAIAWWSLLLGYFFIKLIAATHLGVSVTVFTLMFLGMTLGYYKARCITIPRVGYVYLGLTLLLGLHFMLYGTTAASFIMLLFLIVLSAFSALAAAGTRTDNTLRFAVMDLSDSVFVLPFRHFDRGFLAIGQKSGRNRGRKIGIFVLILLLIGIPVLVLAGWLLSNADAAFEKVWDGLLSTILGDIPITIVQLFVGAPVACYVFSLLYSAVLRKEKGGRKPEHSAKAAAAVAKLPVPVVLGVVLPLILLYILFFFVQMPYLLSAFMGTLPREYSYAEYARRGFFELCSVCSLNMVVLLLTRIFAVKGSKVLEILSSLLCAFSSIFAVIGLTKMMMYIQVYGLTQKRVYTSIFMLFLCLVFLLVLLGLIMKKPVSAKGVMVLALSLILLTALAPVDGIIARWNYSAYQSGYIDDLDIGAIAELREAAVPVLAEILRNENGEFHEQAANALTRINESFRRNGEYSIGDVRNATIVRIRARGILDQLMQENLIFAGGYQDYSR